MVFDICKIVAVYIVFVNPGRAKGKKEKKKKESRKY